MAHINRTSPGTTAFVATLVLTGTFLALAAVVWRADSEGTTAMAARDTGSPVTVEVSPVSTAPPLR